MSIGYLNSNNNNKQKTTKPNREGIGEKQSLFFFVRRTKWWNVTFFRPLDAAHTITTYCNARKKKKKKNGKPQLFFLCRRLSLFSFFFFIGSWRCFSSLVTRKLYVRGSQLYIQERFSLF